MPPEGGKKTRAITKGKPPTSKFRNNGTPLNIGDALVRNSLLPYIELGFMPFSTPVRWEEHAMNALCISLRAAISALKIPTKIPFSELDISNFERWFKSRAYKEKAEKLARKNLNKMYKDKSAEFVAERDRLCVEENLDLPQLEMLLEVANQNLGTEFRLGVITQGFRVQYDMDQKRYDNKFIHNTTCYIVKGDSRNTGRPVVFIIDDNEGEKGYAHRQGRGVESGWEAFTPESSKPELNEMNKREEAVSSWKIERQVEADIAAGVWVVMRDYKPTKASAGVRAGHFIRASEPLPNFVVPDGKKLMRLGDGTTSVIVAEADLAKIEDGEVSIPINAISRPQKPPSPVKAPKPPTKAIKPSKIQKMKRKCIDMSYSELTPWRIFRTLRPRMDKMGKSLKPKVEEVDIVPYEASDYSHHAYQPEFWNLVLDCKKPERGLQVIKFINEEEEEHKIFNRNLQAIENPWGLGDSLPIVPEFEELELDNDYTTDELLAFAKDWGLEAKGNTYSDILQSVRNSYENRTMALPMFQVMTREVSSLGFCLQEIVYVYATKGKYSLVRDYEGIEGRIPTEFLDPFEKPWGLLVWSTQVEVADEPDSADDDNRDQISAKKKRTRGKEEGEKKTVNNAEKIAANNTDRSQPKKRGKAAAAKENPGSSLQKSVSLPKKEGLASKKRKADANELEAEPARKKPSVVKESKAVKVPAKKKPSPKKSKPPSKRPKDWFLKP